MFAKGRIGKRGSHHDWLSRDYETVSCQATGCQFNRERECMVPSRCKIGADGRCSGFQAPPQKKVEGD